MNSILTWSVVNLDKIERVRQDLDEFFRRASRAYETYPEGMMQFMLLLQDAERYGNASDGMIDLSSVFYSTVSIFMLESGFRSEILSALMDAIEYSIRGSGRTGARGLSVRRESACSGVPGRGTPEKETGTLSAGNLLIPESLAARTCIEGVIDIEKEYRPDRDALLRQNHHRRDAGGKDGEKADGYG